MYLGPVLVDELNFTISRRQFAYKPIPIVETNPMGYYKTDWDFNDNGSQ